MSDDPQTGLVADPSFGWDPVLGAWRVVLSPSGAAGSTSLEHVGGTILVDVLDGTVLEAVADTMDGAPGGSVSPSTVTLWRRAFGDVIAGWLEQADGRHTEWRLAPLDPATAPFRLLVGRLAVVERSMLEERAPVWIVEAAQLGADLRITSGTLSDEAADAAELLDDDLLAVVAGAGLASPIRTALRSGGYDDDSLPAVLRPSTTDPAGAATDPGGAAAKRFRKLVEGAASQVSSWFDVQPRPIFAPTSTLRSPGWTSGPDGGATMGMVRAGSDDPTGGPVPLAVQLVDLPADRLLDWEAAIQGDTWAARVSFRGTSVPHLEADLVDAHGDVQSSALLGMESVGSGRVQLRATSDLSALRGVAPEDRSDLVVRLRGVDLDPEVLELATPRTDARTHAASVARSAAGASRWAVAGALEVTGQGGAAGAGVPAASVVGELRWVAARWDLAAATWDSLGDSRRRNQCGDLAADFRSLADRLDAGADPVTTGVAPSEQESLPAAQRADQLSAEQLADRVGAGWSERVARLLARTLVEIWVDRNPYDTTAELADRSARLAEFLGDHVEAASARALLATRTDLPDSRRRVSAHLALAHRAISGRRADQDEELVAIANGQGDGGGMQ